MSPGSAANYRSGTGGSGKKRPEASETSQGAEMPRAGTFAGQREDSGPLSDNSDVPTVRDRLTAAGVSPARIAAHLERGRIRVDGRAVIDLDEPAPPPARVVVWGE